MSVFKPKVFTTMKTYTKEQFARDVTAGIIVAIIALPLSIALAIASGVAPEVGLHTAIIAGFLISLLGGSRVQIGGPTGAFMLIVYGIVMEFGMEGLILSTIMAGLMMVIMGLARFGSVIKFIPYPITTGFTSGIALTIFSSQVKDFLGLEMGTVPPEFLHKWQAYLQVMETIHLPTVAVGVLALLIIVLWPRVTRKIPGAFVALVVTSLVVLLLDLEVATIGSKFGTLSSRFPAPRLPEVSIERIRLLLPAAFTIAVLGSVESLLSAVVSDGMIGGKHRSNMELVAQGIANMASGLFGGIPATGAIARTVANIKNGGRTPVAGMVHSLTLLLILLVFMPLAKVVPLASLAAVLMVVAYNMSEWREFKQLFSSPKSDVLVLLVTFSITVLVDLIVAIEIGVVLAAFLFMKRMADVAEVRLTRLDAAEEEDLDVDFDFIAESERIRVAPYIQLYEINGPFFFGAADKFLDALHEIGGTTETLILRMRNVPSMDATAVHAFKRLLEMCQHDRIKILVSGIQEQPLSVMRKAGIVDSIGQDHFFGTVEEAIEQAVVDHRS
jgi:SulP family sulfate permease